MKRTLIVIVLCLAQIAGTADAAKKGKKRKAAAKPAAAASASTPAAPATPAGPPAPAAASPRAGSASTAATPPAPGATAEATTAAAASATTPSSSSTATATAPPTASSPSPDASPAPAAEPKREVAIAGSTPRATPATSVHESDTRAESTTAAASPAQDDPAPRAARSSDSGLAVAVKVGGIVPTSKLKATYGGSLELAYQPPFLSGLLGRGSAGAAVEVGYCEPKLTSSSTDAAVGAYDYKLNQRLLTLMLEAVGSYSLSAFKPYAGVGLGIYMLRAKITAFGATNTESQTRTGLQLRGGMGIVLGPGDVFAEVRYHYVGLAFLSTGKANAGGVTLAAGYRYSF